MPTTSDNGDPILGGPNIEVFTFTGFKPGETTLKAEYLSFRGMAEGKFELTANVAPAG